jgi:hypothetical protein
MIAASLANFITHSIWLGGREEGLVIGWPKINSISAGLKNRSYPLAKTRFYPCSRVQWFFSSLSEIFSFPFNKRFPITQSSKEFLMKIVMVLS